MSDYTHLSKKERFKIYRLKASGYSSTLISKELKRSKSTIYRELSRNNIRGRYLPDRAEILSKQRHNRGRRSKIISNTAQYYYILSKLKLGLSPEQISGRMKLKDFPYYVCHETIYKYIYNQSREWYKYLRKSKPFRGKRLGRKHGSGEYLNIRPISKRAKHIEARKQLGHWEADTIAFNSSKYQNITTLVERKTRYLIMIKNINRKSLNVMSCILEKITTLQNQRFKTMTFDQGSEFANWSLIEKNSKCITYYCKPRSPWQKGSNENMNGRLRTYFPRKININQITQNDVEIIAKKFNNLPRKILGFKTPNEVLKRNNNKLVALLN